MNQRPDRERIKLFDPHDVNIVDAALFPLVIEVEIDLAGTQNHTFDLAVGHQLDRTVLKHFRIIPQHPVEG